MIMGSRNDFVFRGNCNKKEKQESNNGDWEKDRRIGNGCKWDDNQEDMGARVRLDDGVGGH